MSQMNELYNKVAQSPELQAKFAEIMQKAEVAGKAETDANLLAFAKEAGFDVTMEEAGAFFAKLAEKTPEGELSEVELDIVAGGKSFGEVTATIVLTIVGVGIACAGGSVYTEVAMDGCAEFFKEVPNVSF